MKTKRWIAAVLPLLLAAGCESLNHTENGALAGGAVGAGAGALIGHAAGNTGAGALIGAGVGALSGGLIGSAQDHAEKKAETQAAQARAIAMSDIVSMTQQHVNDAVIINQIRSSPTVFNLSGTDITWLKQNGVSDQVIMEMQATAYRYPRRYYTAVPVYGDPVYVEPPPPVGVGVVIRGR